MFAPAGSLIECSECGLVLYRLLVDRASGDVVRHEDLERVADVPEPSQFLVIECPVHGAMNPNIRRPDDSVVRALGRQAA